MDRKGRQKVYADWLPVAVSVGLMTYLMRIWPDERKARDLCFLLGGIEWQGNGYIDLLAMGKWLFLLGYFILLTGIELNFYKKTIYFSLYRHEGIKRWWRRHFFHIQGKISVVFFGITLIWIIVGKQTGFGTGEVQVVMVYYAHLLCLVSLMVMADIMVQTRAVAGLLIVAEGFGYVLSVNCQCAWLAPGMYVRSQWYSENGFSALVVLILEMLMILLCYAGIPFLWRKGYLEERNWMNGKCD